MAGSVSNEIVLNLRAQIGNLREVASQLDAFSKKHVLGDSLGGQKISKELSNVNAQIDRLERATARPIRLKTDFNAIYSSIGKVRSGLNGIQATMRELKTPDLNLDALGATQLKGVVDRIREIKAEYDDFARGKKGKLLADASFTAGFGGPDAFNTEALAGSFDSFRKVLTFKYDELMKLYEQKEKELDAKQQEIFTQQMRPNKQAFTAWGALEYIDEAKRRVGSGSVAGEGKPKNGGQLQMQSLIDSTMRWDAKAQGNIAWKMGTAENSGFLRAVEDKLGLSQEQMTEFQKVLQERLQQMRIATGKTMKDGLSAFDTLKALSENRERILDAGKGAGSARAGYEAYIAAQEQTKRLRATEYSALYAKKSLTERSYQQLREAATEVDAKRADRDALLDTQSLDMSKYEKELVQLINTNGTFSTSLKNGAQALNQMHAEAEKAQTQLGNLNKITGGLTGVQNLITRYAGLYAVFRKVIQGVKSAVSNIKELDSTMTSIAVVTNMSQSDLWGKIGEYTSIAQQYGVAVNDVYKVSQIYYQQGLKTNQVMALTTETLKMAKIAGMDYTKAADAMTVAVRAFNLEMSEAQRVTDVYSALAANFAVSSAEIAGAMEKTASSAANVGMSIESTSAFMSVMVQTTRESAQNIGSAMKSIIARYGEMKASPKAMQDAEGEDLDFNKTDAALKSVGISIKNAEGQFRDFDDVILELSSKWSTLDNNTQRY